MEAKSVPSEGSTVPTEDAEAEEGAARGERPLERLASFRFTYLAIFLFVVAYVFTIDGLGALLQAHFEERVREATSVNARGAVVERLRDRVERVVGESPWVRIGGVRVRPLVLAADGRTLLYAGGTPLDITAEEAHPARPAEELLPAIVDVEVSVPHGAVLANAVLVGYGALLITVLLIYTRRLTGREQEELESVMAARDAVRERSERIESELARVRERLAEAEPEREIYTDEIRGLQEERSRLEEKLAAVERREAALREQTTQASELQQERRTLEELLEEAAQDLAQKDEEIQSLQTQVKRAARGGRSGGRRTREAEALARRLRTLYKNLEVDDHAVSGLAAFGDETMKLKAEEAMKRLSEDPEQAAVRRKVGGLPPHLSIFEMGFGGKGRIYYTKGRQRAFRVLAVGAKNTQKADLEYLSRLPKE